MKNIFERLKRLPFVAALLRMKHPYESHCFICHLPWSSCKHHFVDLTECTDEHCGEGFFTVCEYCWQRASWDEIGRSVVELHSWWQRDGHNELTLIEMLEKAHKDYNRTHEKK